MAKKKNVSSGADKAEKLTVKKSPSSTKRSEENELANLASGKESLKSTKAVKSTKKTPAKKKQSKSKKSGGTVMSKRAAKRAARADARLARAELRAEKKQKRLERKLEHKEKRQERRAALKEHRAERRERRLERRSESKEAKKERIAEEREAKREAREAKRQAYLADKQAKREHALKVRAEKRAARAEKRHSPGIGGWLAAVISLGVTTLALGTVVTYGWINMDGMQADMASGYTQSLYELNAIVDNLDADLSRATVSNSASDRIRVLSDIAIESQTAETVLERFPLDIQMTEEFASFVNKMNDSAKNMLYTVARGEELSPSQLQSLKYMYETNAKVKEELNNLVATCTGGDLLAAMRGKTSIIGESFTDIQNNTFEAPKGIQDGPFSDSIKKTNPKALEGLEEITAQEAERIAKEMFKSYKVSEAKCTGEATGAALTLYNVNLTTPDGEMLVQISKLGGKVVAFDSYKDCTQNNFSVKRCIDIAEDFLSSVGYTDLKPVWVSENGTTCNLNFAPVQGGAILYPDLIKVKVCEERGIVTGVEAISYVLNHGKRDISEPSISEESAKSNINGDIEVRKTNIALIPFDGGEILCYEFSGSLGNNQYYVYVDAATGEEIEVLTVVGTAQGRALM